MKMKTRELLVVMRDDKQVSLIRANADGSNASVLFRGVM